MNPQTEAGLSALQAALAGGMDPNAGWGYLQDILNRQEQMRQQRLADMQNYAQDIIGMGQAGVPLGTVSSMMDTYGTGPQQTAKLSDIAGSLYGVPSQQVANPALSAMTAPLAAEAAAAPDTAQTYGAQIMQDFLDMARSGYTKELAMALIQQKYQIDPRTDPLMQGAYNEATGTTGVAPLQRMANVAWEQVTQENSGGNAVAPGLSTP